jgi:hypothetical protein
MVTLGNGAASVFGGAGDTISAGTGSSIIDARAGGQAVTLGGGDATVFGGVGDTISAGTGLSVIVLGQGAETIDLGASHGGASLVENGASGGDTVTGFTENHDFISLSSYDTVTAVMGSAQASSAIPNSTMLTFQDGTQLTLVGVTSTHSDFFR